MATRLITPHAPRIEWLPKTTNNAQAEGDLLFITSGALTKAASAANAAVIAGVAMSTLTAAEATALAAAGTKIPVLIDEKGIWSVPVDDATSFDEGVQCDADASGQELDCNGVTYDTFTIKGGTTTLAHVQIRRWLGSDPQAIA